MADSESKKPDTARADARRQPDNFVSKLVPDPANPPDLIASPVTVARHPRKGSTRLYANPELSLYYDIPEGDIAFEQPVPADADPLGAVTLWVKRDSKLMSNAQQLKSHTSRSRRSTSYEYISHRCRRAASIHRSLTSITPIHAIAHIISVRPPSSAIRLSEPAAIRVSTEPAAVFAR